MLDRTDRRAGSGARTRAAHRRNRPRRSQSVRRALCGHQRQARSALRSPFSGAAISPRTSCRKPMCASGATPRATIRHAARRSPGWRRSCVIWRSMRSAAATRDRWARSSELLAIPADVPDPLEEMAALQRQRRALALLEELDPMKRRLVIAAYLHGESREQLAERVRRTGEYDQDLVQARHPGDAGGLRRRGPRRGVVCSPRAGDYLCAMTATHIQPGAILSPATSTAPVRRAARRGARGAARGAAVRAAHAAAPASRCRCHDQLRPARLGDRRGRLPLPGDPSRHRRAVASDPRPAARRVAGSGLLSAPAGGVPDQLLRGARRAWACTRTATRRISPRPWSRSRSAIPACSVSAARAATTRPVRCASPPATRVVLGGEARLAFHGVDRIMPGTSTLLPEGGRINLTLRRVTGGQAGIAIVIRYRKTALSPSLRLCMWRGAAEG